MTFASSFHKQVQNLSDLVDLSLRNNWQDELVKKEAIQDHE